MPKQRFGLGRGLDALIPGASSERAVNAAGGALTT